MDFGKEPEPKMEEMSSKDAEPKAESDFPSKITA